MKRKLWKEIAVAILLVSSILSFSPIAYGETTSVQQSIDVVKMEMKKAALSYVEPALKGELVQGSSLDSLLNSVKKNYQETRKIILASNLSEKEKQAKLKEIEALYEEKIVKGLIPYIDAYNYASKYLDPLLKEIKEAEAKNDFLTVEKAYHKLSVQLNSRTSILYRFTGKVPRDLLLEKYKKAADAKRDELIIPVTIMMKAANAQQLLLAGKKEEAQKEIKDIQALAAKLSSTNAFHQALLKESERLQAIVSPPLVTPVLPTPPVTPPSTGGSGGSSETSAQRALRLAKTDAIKELANYKVDVKDDYGSANWDAISILKTKWTSPINLAKTISEVSQALVNAKADVDKVLTKAQELAIALEKAKAVAIAGLEIYQQTDYMWKNWVLIEGFKVYGKNAINAATTTTAVADAFADAQTKINAVKTFVEEQQDQQNQDLVNTEAANIPLTFAPAANLAGTVSLPTVGADYTISVKSTSNHNRYDLFGRIQADGFSDVVYTVKHMASGKIADTRWIKVTVAGTGTILKVPPILTASLENASAEFPNYILTFMDDLDWRSKITSITLPVVLPGMELLGQSFDISEGKLTSRNFRISYPHEARVQAIGYEDCFIPIVIE